MKKPVHRFDEGGRDDEDLLGGTGANLAEMTRLGLPVPPGFTVTTEACRHFFGYLRSDQRLFWILQPAGAPPAVVSPPGAQEERPPPAHRDSAALCLCANARRGGSVGTRMDRQCAGRMVTRIAVQAHVNTDISPHSLRRTFRTFGLVSGVPLRHMRIAIRHADPRTTTVHDRSPAAPTATPPTASCATSPG